MAFWISLSAVAVVLAMITAAKFRAPRTHASPEADPAPADQDA